MMGDDDSNDIGAALARAQAAVAALSRDYLIWARADLEQCRQHLAAAQSDPAQTQSDPAQTQSDPAQTQEQMTALFNVAHNIKGQGSSFGYPLMTRLGQSLCLLTRKTRPFGAAEFALVAAHLATMEAVLDEQARDEGTDALRARIAEIETAVTRL